MVAIVQTNNLFHAGYEIIPVTNANSIIGSDFNKPNGRITRSKTDYVGLAKRALITINGYLHLSDTDGTNGLVVFDAYKTLLHSQQNQISILSFGQVSTFSVSKFTTSNTVVNNDGTAIIQINVPDTKSVFLSLGGYLCFIDNSSFYPVAPNRYKIDFNKLNMLDRYFESRNYIDLSSMPIETPAPNPVTVNIAEVLSQGNIQAYLNLSQSFIVITDKRIKVDKWMLKKTGLPGRYYSTVMNREPLMNGYGKLNEYISSLENGLYKVLVTNDIVERRIYNTLASNLIQTASANRRPDFPKAINDLCFLTITAV